MKVLCITDGVNTFGTDCEPVKKGNIYNVTNINVPPPNLKHQGFWYELEETPYHTHWSGLFVQLDTDEVLLEDLESHIVENTALYRLKIHLKLQDSKN